jgi:serine/threonine-protein kinase
VPKIVGQPLASALSALRDANLTWQVVEVNSDEDEGSVVSQRPTAGASVRENTRVTVNVSKGPQPIIVPTVIGSSFASASSVLQARGFAVARGPDVESDQAQGTVVSQSPDAGTYQVPGATITLRVSKGPTTVSVPDVTTLAQAEAVQQLRAAGFRVAIQSQDVSDPTQDGIVQSQTPFGTSEANPGSTVTIIVGRFAQVTTSPTPQNGQ